MTVELINPHRPAAAVACRQHVPVAAISGSGWCGGLLVEPSERYVCGAYDLALGAGAIAALLLVDGREGDRRSGAGLGLSPQPPRE